MQGANEELGVKDETRVSQAEATALDEEAVYVPTSEWTAAALAHASILLTATLGTAGGLGVPVGLAVPLVMYFGYRKQSRFIAFHALQAFVYQLAGSLIVAALVILVGAAWSIVPSLPVVGLFMIPCALGLTLLLVSAVIVWAGYGLYAAYQVYQGRDIRYWLIGEWLEREVKL
jgi:uncharacterized membrane protein